MHINWYYTNGDKAIGPLAESTMLELHNCGVISDETKVRQDVSENWGSFKDLFVTTIQPDPGPEPRTSHSFAERLKYGNKVAKEGARVIREGAMVGLAGLKRRSKQAALKVQIEKLRNIDLRKAFHSLGKVAFEQGFLATELTERFQAIQDLDARITGKREKTSADVGETKMGALKRVSEDTAKAGQAQALTVKREHLITELGREVHARNMQLSELKLSEESAAIADIEHRIRSKGDEIRELDDKGQSLSSATDLAQAFSINRLIPLFVCCLLFGWVTSGFLMPNRFFISSNIIGQIIPVAMLGVPSLILAIMGICHFVRPFQFPTKKAIGVLLFTMLFGLAGLLIFQSIAGYAIHSDSLPKYLRGLHGKSAVAGGFIMSIVFVIGKAYQYAFDPSSNILQQFFGFIFGVGFCEEAIKLLPLFWFVGGRNRSQTLDFRGFLILGFFSGLGFGIGEAVGCYSPWSLFMNPNPNVDSNVLRWFALVPSHAIWTVIDAAFLWLLAPKISNAKSNYAVFGFFVLCIMTVAVVHGVYDVLCGIPGMGILFSIGSIFLMYFVVVWVAKKTGDAETIQEHEMGAYSGILGWLKNSKAGQMRFGRLYSTSVALIAASLLFSDKIPVSLHSEDQYDQPTSQKQKANRGAFDLYMQGYNDPRQGEVAEIMMNRASGQEAQGYAIIALGGEDRKAGLPPRFELDNSL